MRCESAREEQRRQGWRLYLYPGSLNERATGNLTTSRESWEAIPRINNPARQTNESLSEGCWKYTELPEVWFTLCYGETKRYLVSLIRG